MKEHSDLNIINPGFGDTPVGSVVAFAGNLGAPVSCPPDGSGYTAPEASPPKTCVTDNLEAWGWMLCDGRSLSTGQYPQLFAVLGYQYGGSGNSFNIPDYRGYFMRGVSGNSGNDPDPGARTVPSGGSGTASEVGSIQQSALQVHTHKYNVAPVSSTPTDPSSSVGATAFSQSDTGTPLPSGIVSQTETRPINIYVNYIIKFTYGLKPTMGFPHHEKKKK